MKDPLLLAAGHNPLPIARASVSAVFEMANAVRWARKTNGTDTVWMHYAVWDESLEYAALNSLASSWAHRTIYGPAVFSTHRPLPELYAKMTGLEKIYF